MFLAFLGASWAASLGPLGASEAFLGGSWAVPSGLGWLLGGSWAVLRGLGWLLAGPGLVPGWARRRLRRLREPVRADCIDMYIFQGKSYTAGGRPPPGRSICI